LRESHHFQLAGGVISRGTLKLATAICGSSKVGPEIHAIKAFI
jgi:hypothetical protein